MHAVNILTDTPVSRKGIPFKFKGLGKQGEAPLDFAALLLALGQSDEEMMLDKPIFPREPFPVSRGLFDTEAAIGGIDPEDVAEGYSEESAVVYPQTLWFVHDPGDGAAGKILSANVESEPNGLTVTALDALRKGGVANFRLGPMSEDLGEVRVSLEFTQGKLTANLFVANHLTHDNIEQALTQLKESLAQHKIVPDKITVLPEIRPPTAGRHGGAFAPGGDLPEKTIVSPTPVPRGNDNIGSIQGQVNEKAPPVVVRDMATQGGNITYFINNKALPGTRDIPVEANLKTFVDMSSVEPTVNLSGSFGEEAGFKQGKSSETGLKYDSIAGPDNVDNSTAFNVNNLTATRTDSVKMVNLMDAVARHVQVMEQKGEGATRLQLKLEPEHLGEVTVKLSFVQGKLSAQFIAASHLAREAIDQALAQLKENLAQHNIVLDEASVSLNEKGDPHYPGKETAADQGKSQADNTADYGERGVDEEDGSGGQNMPGAISQINYLV